MNVYDHFAAAVGASPDDATLQDLDTKSTCGRSCALAIDAGKALNERVTHAYGGSPKGRNLRNEVRTVVSDVVSVYWRGWSWQRIARDHARVHPRPVEERDRGRRRLDPWDQVGFGREQAAKLVQFWRCEQANNNPPPLIA